MKKLDIELDLPDNTVDLNKAEKVLNKIEKELNWYKDTETSLTDLKKETFIKTIDIVLDSVGLMSRSRFEVRETIEDHYALHYKKQPALGKSMYLKHYESLHKPYDKLKRKSYKLLENISPMCD